MNRRAFQTEDQPCVTRNHEVATSSHFVPDPHSRKVSKPWFKMLSWFHLLMIGQDVSYSSGSKKIECSKPTKTKIPTAGCQKATDGGFVLQRQRPHPGQRHITADPRWRCPAERSQHSHTVFWNNNVVSSILIQ